MGSEDKHAKIIDRLFRGKATQEDKDHVASCDECQKRLQRGVQMLIDAGLFKPKPCPPEFQQ